MSSVYDKKNNLIFIHVPKTAGSAITKLICPNLPDYDGPKDPLQEFVRLGRFHWTAKKIKNTYPEIFSKARVFAIVRNPFTWIQSMYYHQLQRENTPYHTIASEKGFEYFLKYFTEHDGRSMTQFIYDKKECLVDDILRFESFSSEIIPYLHKSYVFDVLPMENVTQIPKKAIEEEYNEQAFSYVAEHYSDDIKNLSYEEMAKNLLKKIRKEGNVRYE